MLRQSVRLLNQICSPLRERIDRVDRLFSNAKPVLRARRVKDCVLQLFEDGAVHGDALGLVDEGAWEVSAGCLSWYVSNPPFTCLALPFSR